MRNSGSTSDPTVLRRLHAVLPGRRRDEPPAATEEVDPESDSADRRAFDRVAAESVRWWAAISERYAISRRGAVAAVAVLLVAAVAVGLVVWRSRPTPSPLSDPAPVAGPFSTPAGPFSTPAAPSGSAARSEPGAPTGSGVVLSSGSSIGASPSLITVAVVGRVRRPGVVQLSPGARVVDAIAAAGGVATGGRLGLLNLAQPLTDGQQVVVGVPGSGVSGGAAGSGSDAATDSAASGAAGPAAPVNLNQASLAQLDTLPGIGPALAQRILDYRAANGPFQRVDQLQDVSGIGPEKYASLAPKVTV